MVKVSFAQQPVAVLKALIIRLNPFMFFLQNKATLISFYVVFLSDNVIFPKKLN